MMDIKVDLKQARREMFRVRGRFLKLQRTVIGEALEFASVPTVQAAKANAPSRTGRLRERIQFVPPKAKRGLLTVDVGPVKFSKREKGFPYWGLIQEVGSTGGPRSRPGVVPGYWRATGRAKAKNAKDARLIAGKHFLKRAGESNFSRTEKIFAERVFRGLQEIQSAGESAGLA